MTVVLAAWGQAAKVVVEPEVPAVPEADMTASFLVAQEAAVAFAVVGILHKRPDRMQVVAAAAVVVLLAAGSLCSHDSHPRTHWVAGPRSGNQ